MSITTALQSEAFGYIGAAVAVLFFGSNYVVAKKYPTGDGLAFQWFMCIGIFTTGFLFMFLAGESPQIQCHHTVTFEWFGLLGGALWATGNLLVPTAINFLGVGLALLLWSCANLLWGWCIGVFGLFGTEKEEIAIPALNYVGLCCGLVSLFLFFFIKPTLEEVKAEAETADEGEENLLPSSPISYHTLGSVSDEYMRTVLEEQSEDPDETTVILEVANSHHSFGSSPSPSPTNTHRSDLVAVADDKPDLLPFGDPELEAIPVDPTESFFGILLTENKKRVIGILLSLTAGSLYGVCLVPFQVWFEKNESPSCLAPHGHNQMEWVFSHYLGIFLMSTFAFLVYVAIHRNAPQIFPSSIVPAFLSGAMWGIAQAFWLVANGTLGLTVAYPIVTLGPTIVSSLWSVFLFKEIRGRRNLIILSVAMLSNITCVLMVAFSQKSSDTVPSEPPMDCPCIPNGCLLNITDVY